MASANQLRPSVVNLEGGLDFVSPKLSVEPGSLIDCYNFEVADRSGYKRIDGLEPFDGRLSPSAAYTNTVFVEVTFDVGGFTVGDYCKVGGTFAIDNPILGQIAREYAWGVPERNGYAIVVTDYVAYYLLLGATSLTSLDGSTVVATIVAAGGPEITDITAVDDQFNEYVNIYSNQDERVGTLPGGRYFTEQVGAPLAYTPATGMTWYKERLYITQDLDIIRFGNADEQIYANDVLETGDAAFRVLDLRIINGAYGTADADGFMLVHKESGDYPSGNTPANIVRTETIVGSVDINCDDPGFMAPEKPWMGGLWRSTSFEQAEEVLADQGWEWIDNGYVMDYKEGEAYGTPAQPPPKIGREVVPTAVSVNSNTDYMAFETVTCNGAIWTLEGGAADNEEALEAADTKYLSSNNASGYGSAPITTITLSTLDLDSLPDDAVILGIEVLVRAKLTTAGAEVPRNIKVQMSATNSIIKQTAALTASYQDLVVGGANDLWQASGLTAAFLRSAGFNVKISPTHRDLTLGGVHDVDRVAIKIYYQVTVDKLFFWNGTDDVEATICNYSIDDGDWADGDAKGQMHVVNVQPYASATRTYIAANDQIRTASGGAGTLVAVIASDMVYAGVPSFDAMQTENSRSEIIVNNFYGLEDWQAIYAVNGAGRAWTYDDFYFRYIYTGLPVSKDKPRHVVFFKFHLGLGYAAGNVTFSVEGEPENYSGIDGASAFDVGDRVNGLIPMNGSTLGIFCESKILGLQGSTLDDVVLTVLNPYQGAIEYCVVDIGKPVYATSTGISTFDQTAAYGDFLGFRMSAKVQSWLLPRLQGKAPVLGSLSIKSTATDRAVSQKAVFMHQCGAKNQVILWFADGYRLVMTLFGQDQVPVYTISRLYDGKIGIDTDKPLIPFCHSRATDANGSERIHISDYNPLSATAFDGTPYRKYCYELERGWLFRDGTATNTIHGTFTLTHNFFNDPFSNKTLKKICVHGQSKGRGKYYVSCQDNYLTEFADSGSVEWQPISLPRDSVMGSTGPPDYFPTADIVNVAKRGYNIAIRFREQQVNQPPVVFQTMVLELSPDGKGYV